MESKDFNIEELVHCNVAAKHSCIDAYKLRHGCGQGNERRLSLGDNMYITNTWEDAFVTLVYQTPMGHCMFAKQM